MVYLFNMVIFHGYVSHNQMVTHVNRIPGHNAITKGKHESFFRQFPGIEAIVQKQNDQAIRSRNGQKP